jgi:hypothetical protein
MKTDVIGIRIDQETSKLMTKLIGFGIVKNKTDGIRWIMRYGMQAARKIVERKEQSRIIIEKWKMEGFPALPENLSDLSIRERE